MGVILAATASADSLFLDASDFNVFVGNGFTGTNSDVQGRLAAGGDFSVQNYSIGTGLAGFSGNSVLVGGNFNYNTGQVFYGNVLTADSTPTTTNLNVLNGSLIGNTPLPIYIPTLMTELIARSGYVGSLSANGTTNLSFGTLTLSGGTGATRIFNVTASQLSSATNFVLNAPAGTTAVVNVSGTSATFQNAGYSLTGGIANTNVLLNFWQATSLNMSGIGIQGTVFAPQANVSFNNGQLNGQLIASSFTGSGEMHIATFGGTVPVPEPVSLVAVGVGLAGLIRRRKK